MPLKNKMAKRKNKENNGVETDMIPITLLEEGKDIREVAKRGRGEEVY